MQKIIVLLFFFCASLGLNANENREPNSPKGDYKFSLKDIQKTVRTALERADEEIKLLIELGELEGVSYLYFQKYLQKIASYNEVAPQTVDLVESYKTELVNAFVLKEFKDTFPELIYDKSEWMLNSVGGIYANMIILHCSPKEYLVLWGTTLEADNKFSGYYPFMNEFDVMVRGEMQSHDLRAPGHASVIYRPKFQDGHAATTVDTSNLIPNNERVYNLMPHTYMVSYAQGNILKAFVPGAIMPGVFVNQDWSGLYSHIKEGILAFLTSKKKAQKSSGYESLDWQKNPNYRAITIIDQYRNVE